MANSVFPAVVGGANGGNAHIANLLDTDQLGYGITPELCFAHTVTWKDLKRSTAVAESATLLVGGTIAAGAYAVTLTDARTGIAAGTVTTQVHEDTITIAGTVSDGNYDAIFDSVGVRARVVRDTTPADNDAVAAALSDAIDDLIATDLAGIVASVSASTNVVTIVYEADIDAQTITTAETTATGTITATVSADADAVALALEALLQTARATTFAALLEGESVATDTITMDFVDGEQVTPSASFPGGATATITITNVATIPMGRTGDWFPAAVFVDGCIVNRATAFAGGTPTITMTVGDAGAVDGLFTSTSIASAGVIDTIAAAEHTEHYEATFQPLMTITSNRVFTSLTAGEVTALISYTPPPTI